MSLRKLIFAIIIVICLFWIPVTSMVFGAEESISISWTMPEGSPAPTGFRLYQSDAVDMLSRQMILQINNGNFPQTKPATVIIPDEGGTIYFAMTAFNANGESELSEVVAKTFETAQPPYRPMSFTISIDGAGNITVEGR